LEETVKNIESKCLDFNENSQTVLFDDSAPETVDEVGDDEIDETEQTDESRIAEESALAETLNPKLRQGK